MASFIRIGLFIISWATVFFLPKQSIKKYLPASTFVTILLLIQCMLSNPFKWWTVKGGLLNKILTELCFVLGPFFVGTIWIFRLTFGNFWLYMVVNTMMDALFAFPMNALFEKLKVYKLVNWKPKTIFYVYITYAAIIYGYQYVLRKPNQSESVFHKLNEKTLMDGTQS
jgi:hypothetical protein